MSNSIASAIANLLSSLASIGASLINSILAVFQAVFALLQDVASSILQLAQAIIAFAADFFQGVIGFVAGKSSWLQSKTTTQAGHPTANFLGLLVVGGIYYWYTHPRAANGRSGSRKSLVSG